eukprot:TRINITY_DN4478_c0_g1_i1.p1 TRINITY_DN4478_c0_g1~~TRINITY_DN4478_c0_g1_i1.p1  ORF type:complete len:241 (-),score=58.72 TRINITY_DN4478_c0_g1_i1:39-761(-)
MSEQTIRKLDNNTTIFSVPFKRFNLLKVGGRATAIRLKNGDVFVFSPVKAQESTFRELESLGNVKYLVCPNTEHSMYVADYKKRYPNAKVIGVEGLDKKRTEVSWDGLYQGESDNQPQFGFEDEIDARYFRGSVNKDVLFLHKEGKTLLVADVLFNLPPKEQHKDFGPIQNILLGSMNPQSTLHRLLTYYMLTKDKGRMRKDATFVASNWKFERIIPCHGDVIEKDGQTAWKNAMQDFID